MEISLSFKTDRKLMVRWFRHKDDAFCHIFGLKWKRTLRVLWFEFDIERRGVRAWEGEGMKRKVDNAG